MVGNITSNMNLNGSELCKTFGEHKKADLKYNFLNVYFQCVDRTYGL